MKEADLTAADPVEVLVSFLNTFHVELDRESLARPADLVRWARENGLGTGLGTLHDRDLSAAVSTREALRSYLADRDGRAPAALTPLLSDVRLGVTLGESGVRLAPLGTGWALLWARLAVLLHQAQAEGRLSRLKICPGENCAWAFHDRSRNGSRTWCSEQVCGARTRSRRYRQHRRETA